jgi:hypothetical protein
MFQDWMKAGFALWVLQAEAAVVIGLRGMAVAAGGTAATAEMQRMVTEKMAAGLGLQALALSGGLGRSLPDAIARSARYYGRKVRANRRRLTQF